MPRERAEATVKKAEFVKKLVEKNPETSQRDLAAAVIEKFETGLSLQIIGNIKNGRDPFAKPKKKRKAKKAAKSQRKRGKKKASKKRRGRRTASPAGAAYLVTVVGNGTMIGADSKPDAKAEVTRLVDSGVDPEDIIVYSQERLTVRISSHVSFE